MYGIVSAGSGALVLCKLLNGNYVMKLWSRARNIVMLESSIEIDRLMQQLMVDSGQYGLSVYKFSEAEEASIIMDKLSGRH